MRVDTVDRILSLQQAPSWVVLYCTVEVDIDGIIGRFRERWGEIPLVGCSSFHGVFTPSGFARGAFALVGEAEDQVEMVVEAGETERDVFDEVQFGARALSKAMPRPDVLLLHATPGAEETVIKAIDPVFSSTVPIFGGSAADDDLSGRWRVFDIHGAHANGYVLAGFRSKKKVYGELLGGYLATRHAGVVTRARGRLVEEIDGRPAAEVYNEWSNGSIREALGKRAPILGETSLYPVGRIIKKVLGVPIHLLSHPAFVSGPENGLEMFSEFSEGEELFLMRGSEEALVKRTSMVVRQALTPRAQTSRPLSGGILIYCGGCVGAIESRIDAVVEEFRVSVQEAPFIGVATFGEQGWARGTDGNRHGNLMCDVVLFDSV
ncbi:MAG: FIST N-terminal domain-containing protein [Myxococcota bacterium]|jgi:hypothetical protein|nr:FIST N-terminal domain-containing protein [Myxococcota bacterium]